jgi:hypothetical protein
MKIFAIAAFIVTTLMSGCGRANMKTMKVNLDELNEIPQTKWDALAAKKIYFGHQSVGFNLIEGINNVMKEVPGIKLNIQETNSPEAFGAPIFAHSKIGKNRDPKLKCDDFRAVMDSGVGSKADIAFFKLCFVDVIKGTDIKTIFDNYTPTMEELQAKYPKVKFIHMTVPLIAHDNSMKASIKRFLGFAVSADEDNIARNAINEMFRAKYRLNDDLFDLADAESTQADGEKTIFFNNGKQYYCMADEWTYDGGHFNEAGGKMLTKQFLLFLTRRIK